MNNLAENATEILILLFLIITFLQSGIDKVIDWKGNLSWLTGHFSGTPLQKTVPALLGVVLVTEILAGVLCALGLYEIMYSGGKEMGFLGAVISCIALLMLLFGQRIAKDYEGAKTIAIYFVPAIFLVFLMQG